MAGPLAAVRAVVFDLDGTLVDSLPDIAGHLNTALAEAGLPTRTLDEVRGWVGRGADWMVGRAVADPARVPDVIARYRAHYTASPFGRTGVFPGLGDALDALVASGRALGVLSNKPHVQVVPIVDALLARWRFDVIAGERPGVPRKPDPAALVGVLDALGVARDAAVLVGDSEVDVATARAAGVPSVAVTWGLRDPAALAAVAPDHTVETPAQLAALFA